MLLRRAGLTASAGLSCCFHFEDVLDAFVQEYIRLNARNLTLNTITFAQHRLDQQNKIFCQKCCKSCNRIPIHAYVNS